MPYQHLIGSIVALLAVCLTTPSAMATQGDIATRAEAAREMTHKELYRIFRNHTWVWPDGGGYFRVSKREFTAYSNQGRKGSIAKGRWYLSEKGRVCFRATWTSVDWSVGKNTCFAHRTDGRHIYQKRLPDGDWYVFKHTPLRSYDEITKFRHGDRVSAGYQRNKGYINANQKQTGCGAAKSLHHFLLCLFRR